MSDITWNSVTVSLDKLIPWERNPKYITPEAAQRLLQLWDSLGQFQTLAIGPNYELYDGHQRLPTLMAAYGPKYEVDARQSSRPLTEHEREELTIAAHAGTIGSWDWDALSGWDTDDLRTWGLNDALLSTWNTDAMQLRGMLTAIAAEEVEPPAEFEEFDEGIETEYRCPKCGYAWSGKPS